MQPERPTVATHAGTVATGWLEIEDGIELDRYKDRSHGASVPLVIKLGVAPRVQFSLFVPLLHPPGQNTTGVGDLSAAIKWRLAEHAPVVGDFAILPSIKFPTAQASLTTGTTDLGLLLISSHDFGAVAMDLNAGMTRRSHDTKVPRYASLWTASFGGSAIGHVGWVGEVYGDPATSGPAGSRAIVAALAGPTLEMRRWLVLDAGVIVPLRGPQPRAVYSGFVYNVGRVWK
ncbi:MAG TPA: hypothetical protein VF505_03780 [Thermoanaerobaculia bacterium]